MTAEYDLQATLAWRQSMDAALRRDEGWLSLCGLFWLSPGVNRIGCARGCPLLLPPGSAPAHVGDVVLDGDQAQFRAAPDVEAFVAGAPVEMVTLRPDTSAAPTRVRLGEVTSVLVQRGDRQGLRVRHRASPNRRAFPGRTWFPVRGEYLRPAAFVRYAPPVPMTIVNVLGDSQIGACPGHVEFHLGGAPARLLVTEADDDGLFLLFADATNGESTYPAGRFLTTDAVQGDRVWLDFNRAYSPPCAFTPFATCPLPSPENRLPMPVEAGERFDATWGHLPPRPGARGREPRPSLHRSS
jgi:hypothetical protein